MSKSRLKTKVRCFHLNPVSPTGNSAVNRKRIIGVMMKPNLCIAGLKRVRFVKRKQPWAALNGHRPFALIMPAGLWGKVGNCWRCDRST